MMLYGDLHYTIKKLLKSRKVQYMLQSDAHHKSYFAEILWHHRTVVLSAITENMRQSFAPEMGENY